MAPLEELGAEPLAALEEAEGAAGGERGAERVGAPGCRVRFALGVSELPGEHAVVVLHEDAILRWRPTPKRPDGAPARLAEVAVGAAIAVEHGGIWDEGLVLGRVVRPARAGGFRVDGDSTATWSSIRRLPKPSGRTARSSRESRRSCPPPP
ncbi:MULTISPECIES: hypothetical protein [Sorangium]|uniref:Uncharacterized protein n=1 Tax=Sorangium cellulosum TaxID=56 RepID=A0A4P2R5P8_SORCE|nr:MULTISPECIES: hypothetical protein [Sorangium]AUX38425.1 uncharacterized protein SOCE836_106690 [Sorangium cellulosum]WCQ97713.1 hypothetical protein NQZ70_10509 [Sorangium sp. Soce836]